MARMEIAGKTALVTGASSGLGVDFARELASRGAGVILVARREEQLKRQAQEIASTYGVQAHAIAMDLGTPEAPQQLFDRVKADGHAVSVLINNAGFGAFGDALAIPWERENAMLQLDIVTLVHLSKLFGRDMVARRDGTILQLASTGAYQPSPGYASYSAAKAFVLSYGYALNYELRGSGVSCTVLSPGVTATEFLQVSGQRKTWFHKLTMMDSPTVAKKGIEAMLARRGSIVTGWLNKLASHSARMNPRWLQTAIAHQAMKN